MRLRTNHGTYVVAREDGELLHLAEPLDRRFQSVWSGAAPPALEPGAVKTAVTAGPLAPATLVVLADGLVAFRRDGLYLCADPSFTALRFDREQVGPWEGFAIEATDGTLVVYEQAEPSRLQGELDFGYAFMDPSRLPMSGEALPFSLHSHSVEDLASQLGGVASIETVSILLRTDSKSIEFHYVNADGGRRLRILDCIRYAYYALSTHQTTMWDVLAARDSVGHAWMIRFEVGDLPTTAEPSAAFERCVGDTKFTLVPDLYYFDSKGFRCGWFAGDIQPWGRKANRFVWRGSTTGAHDLTLETVAQVHRVHLCEIGRSMGSVADFGITDVVHARSAVDAEDIKLFLKDKGLWRDRMPQHVMGGAKFLIEIDGNANSWGFLAKLLMGCCILKVDSPYEQWFYDRLQPWVHYVPVANNLSDLSDKVEWCLHNEETCREIAEAGLRFAESLSFDTQMAAAAQAFLSVAVVAD